MDLALGKGFPKLYDIAMVYQRDSLPSRTTFYRAIDDRIDVLIDIVLADVAVYNALLDVAARQRSLPPRFHAELSESLTSGDVQKADEAMRRHVNFGFPSVVEGLKPSHVRRWRMSGKPNGARD